MGAVLVVVVPEVVELLLEFGQGRRRWVGGQPAFEGLVEAFDLALGLWWLGEPFFWVMPSRGSRYSKALRPPPNRAV